jgi:uncharacterized lipoprotein
VTADLVRFYNDHKTGFFAADAAAELRMGVSVKKSSSDRQGKEENTLLMGGENARLALERALENGMKTLFEDRTFISALLSTAKK